MSLNIGEEIGLEMHLKLQLLRVKQGQEIVQIGKNKDHLKFKRNVYDDSALIIPAGI